MANRGSRLRMAAKNLTKRIAIQCGEEIMVCRMTGSLAVLDPEGAQTLRRQSATPAKDRPQIIRTRKHRRQGYPQNRPQRILTALAPTPVRNLTQSTPQCLFHHARPTICRARTRSHSIQPGTVVLESTWALATIC